MCIYSGILSKQLLTMLTTTIFHLNDNLRPKIHFTILLKIGRTNSKKYGCCSEKDVRVRFRDKSTKIPKEKKKAFFRSKTD